MLVLSNRNVFVLGQVVNDGIRAWAIWLKDPKLAGTQQELWDRQAKSKHGLVEIPADTAQVHTDIFLPYVVKSPMAVTANHT